VDFELTTDQVDLQEGMRAFVDGRFPIDFVRAIEDGGGRLDRARWQELGETGVFSLRLPEADGGLELGVSEAVLVFQELGRALVPGPLVATHLAAELVPEAAIGEQIVGILAPSEPVTMVEFLDDLDALLVLADDGVRRIDPATLTTRNVDRPLDPLSPVRIVTGDIPGGELIAGPEVAQRLLLTGAVLTGGLQVGIAERTVELATEYAKEREQFGRAIGSFQAIKHLIADMFVKAAVARAGVESAACALDGRSDDDPVRAASAAKIMADEAARFCARTCIQVHGGIGYTWEVDVQRFWKRACVLDTHFGSVDEHAEVVASTL
jgi:alkylation response protein AidB-like acyl-CoA dehydrogenase